MHAAAPVAATAPPAGAEEPRAPASAWYTIFVLTVILVIATVDRAIIGLLAEPIKKSLELSDLQLGLMQGTGIALFTALAGFPLAWLSDKLGRKPVLVLSVVVWSCAVVACAFAGSFWSMMLATAMVGAGEAGLAPIAYALIGESFRGRQRQTANSIFVVAAATGGGLAMVITGQVITWTEPARALMPLALQGLEGWRLSFLLAALPAPLLIAVILTLRTARRSVAVKAAVAQLQGKAITLGQHMRQHGHTVLSFCIGIGFAIFAFGAVGSWLAVICMRLFGQTPAQVGNALGAISLGAIAIGFVVTTFVLRAFAARLGRTMQVRVMWISTLLATTTSFPLAFATSATHVYMIQAVQAVLLSTANMLYPTALQDLAPDHLRARVVSIQVVINVCMGAAAAPVVGFVSDRMGGQPNALLVAASGTAVVGLLLATVVLRWCERGYAETVERIASDERAHHA